MTRLFLNFFYNLCKLWLIVAQCIPHTHIYTLQTTSVFVLNSGYVTSFLPVCTDSKFPRSGEECLWSRSQNQESPWGTQRVIDQYLCSVSPTRSLRGLSTPELNHQLIHCSLNSRLGSDMGSQP